MVNLKKAILSLLGVALGGFSLMAAPAFQAEQYQKALWMTARFYGAQRMGDGVNWLVADHEPTRLANGIGFQQSAFVKGKSFLKDADGSYDLTGGWFDCGDHVLFGQTFFYSAYMLLLGYSEFPAGYDDYYSFDYTGYVKSGDYTWEGKKGVPNGIPDILDEAKYATDFIIKAFRDNKTFYYQKGDDSDHNVWCTSTVKSALPKANGGNADGSRAVKKASGNATSMASLGGAALAVMARVYRPFDPEYADLCLKKAVVAYEYVTGTSKGNTGAGGYYGAKPKYVPDMVTFFAEMYRTTGDKKYLSAAEENCGWMDASKDYNYNFSLGYNNTEDLAAYAMANLGDASSVSKKAMQVMDFYINTMYKPGSGYMLNAKFDDWGALRYPCNQAFSHALYSKLKGEKEIDPYTLTTIEFIMGKNPSNLSFIVGFGSKHPVIPHHRNFFRYDGNDMGAIPVPNSSYKFIQLGFLVGGNGNSVKSGAYTESLSNYESSEGGIDYNAGLVGALGYINSMISPVNTNKFGHPTPELGEKQSICGKSSIELDSKVAADGKKMFTWYKDGKKVASSTSATTYKATAAGEYTCEIDSAGDWTTSSSVVIEALLPTVEYDAEFELCNPASVTMDFSYDAASKYVWSKDGKEIEGANVGKYEVTKAGKYICAVSAENCGTQEYGFTVTSLLPEVEDAESDINGNVTLKVTSDGDYEWYDVAEGGKPLATGSSYKTVITEDKVFYVQDAGAMDIVVGPSEKDLSGTSVNWGKMPVRFKAAKECMITGVTLILTGTPYNTGTNVVTAELSGDASGKYTSESINVTSGMKSVKVTFANPIMIPKAGSYSLLLNCDAFAIGYFEGKSDYASFPHQGEPLTFVGVDKDKSGFMGVADWNVTAGSGCARAVVKAKKGNSAASELVVNNIVAGLYPNPVNDLLTIELFDNQEADVEVLNVFGSVVAKTRISATEKSLNLSALSKGIYVVRVSNGESVYTERIVKK